MWAVARYEELKVLSRAILEAYGFRGTPKKETREVTRGTITVSVTLLTSLESRVRFKNSDLTHHRVYLK